MQKRDRDNAKRYSVKGLLGLGRSEKIECILNEVYRVQGRQLAKRFVDRGDALKYTQTELIDAMLKIVPGSSKSSFLPANDDGAAHRDVIASLLERSDHYHHKAIRRIVAARSKGSGSSAKKVVDAEISSVPLCFDRTIDWSGYFAADLENDAELNAMTTSGSSEQYLIAVRHEQYGVLIGPRVTFCGAQLEDGDAKIEPGWALFGPRIDLLPSFYILEVDLEVRGSDSLLLDIVTNCGLKKIFEANLIGKARFCQKFEIGPEDDMLEVRMVNETGRSINVRLNSVVVKKAT